VLLRGDGFEKVQGSERSNDQSSSTNKTAASAARIRARTSVDDLTEDDSDRNHQRCENLEIGRSFCNGQAGLPAMRARHNLRMAAHRTIYLVRCRARPRAGAIGCALTTPPPQGPNWRGLKPRGLLAERSSSKDRHFTGHLNAVAPVADRGPTWAGGGPALARKKTFR